MLFWLDHLAVLVLAVFFPLRAITFGYRRLLEAAPDDVPSVRRSLLVQALILQWVFAFALLALWAWRGRSWDALGLVPRDGLGLLLGVAASMALALGLWMMRARARRDPEALARLLEGIRNLERILPRTREELRLFYAVSVTAGVCEELLYRGYLLWYFGHGLSIFPALAVAAAIFGFGHAYQGWKGVLGTTLVGALLGTVYLLSGSLWPAMLIHAITDIHAGSLAHAALTRPTPETGPAEQVLAPPEG
jgi:membrane protease YdiL (CAAX protease family)